MIENKRKSSQHLKLKPIPHPKLKRKRSSFLSNHSGSSDFKESVFNASSSDFKAYSKSFLRKKFGLA